MLPQQRTKTNLGLGLAVLLQLASLFFVQARDMTAMPGLVLILVSVPVFIWGCMHYADGKGQSKWLGMVGLAGPIGLVVLILLPDQNCPGAVPRSQRRKYVGLISVVAGSGIAVLGIWLHSLGNDVRLERMLGLWSYVCMLLGLCIVIVGSLVFTLGNDSR